VDDICLSCGKKYEPEPWGAECDCDAPNVVHQIECVRCGRIAGIIIDDDYCNPEIFYCPDCMDRAKRNITHQLSNKIFENNLDDV